MFWALMPGTGVCFGLRALSLKKTMPINDPHSRHLKCEGHLHDRCPICRDFKPQMKRDRKMRLCHLLMEASLRPPSEPFHSGCAPNTYLSVRSAPLDIVDSQHQSPSDVPRKKHRQHPLKEPSSFKRSSPSTVHQQRSWRIG